MPKQAILHSENRVNDRNRYRLTLDGLRFSFKKSDRFKPLGDSEIDFSSVGGLQNLTELQRHSFFCTWSHNRKFKLNSTLIPRPSPQYSFLEFAIVNDNAAVIRQFFHEALTEFRDGNGTAKISLLNKRCGRGFSLVHYAAQHGASDVLRVLKEFCPESLYATVGTTGGELAGASVAYVAAYYNQYSVFDYLEKILTKNFIRPILHNGNSIVNLAVSRGDKFLLDLIWRKDRSALYDPLSDGRLPIHLAIEKNCSKSLTYLLSLKHSKSDLHPFMTAKTAASEFLDPKRAEKNIALYLTSSIDVIQRSVSSMRYVYALVSSKKKKKTKRKIKTIFSAVDTDGKTPWDRIIEALGLTSDDSHEQDRLCQQVNEFYAFGIEDFSHLKQVLTQENYKTNALSF
jgi:hypothetical protein